MRSAEGHDFDATLAAHGLAPLARSRVTTLQLQIGRRCDLACTHCHVEAGPKRTEAMDRRGIERVLALLDANPGVELLDVTGGAPELHPEFRFLVASLPCYEAENVDRQRGRSVFARSIDALRHLNARGYGRPARRSASISSSTPRARLCRPRRPSSKRAIARSSRSATASSSTTCSRSRTCRSSASPTRSPATAASTPTSSSSPSASTRPRWMRSCVAR
jgi:hypothetical protein